MSGRDTPWPKCCTPARCVARLFCIVRYRSACSALSNSARICMQGQLVPIYLFYCLLGDPAAFARHWPPQLAYPGWLALMREVGATNLVPGT